MVSRQTIPKWETGEITDALLVLKDILARVWQGRL